MVFDAEFGAAAAAPADPPWAADDAAPADGADPGDPAPPPPPAAGPAPLPRNIDEGSVVGEAQGGKRRLGRAGAGREREGVAAVRVGWVAWGRVLGSAVQRLGWLAGWLAQRLGVVVAALRYLDARALRTGPIAPQLQSRTLRPWTTIDAAPNSIAAEDQTWPDRSSKPKVNIPLL